jgi:hypothetical protein
MRLYVINFFVWWYRVQLPYFVRKFADWVAFNLEYTNTLPMARNWNVPLFQDTSGAGKFISIIIRSIWVWVGGMMVVILSLGPLVALAVYALLPLLVLVQLLLSLIGIFS